MLDQFSTYPIIQPFLQHAVIADLHTRLPLNYQLTIENDMCSGKELDNQLSNWLSEVQKSVPARAIISPHAGYSYCGASAAHAYKQINPEAV